MLNKLKEVMQTTMDAVAPPPPLLDDFIYHWRRFMKYYLNPDPDHESKAAVELTNLPICLHRLRKILIDEDSELEEKNCTAEVGPCMEYLLKFNLLDLLVTLAISDEPPGMKQYILKFFSKTLTQLKKPNVAHSSMYVPLVRLMNVCDGLLHTVSEKEEVEFLLHLSAVLRKQPALSLLFFSDESIKNLTEVTNSGDYIKYMNILDLALSYVDSADSEIRVKACQCIILLCSMTDDIIAQCIVKNFKLNHFLIGRLITLFYEIPPNDFIHFENIKASWALDVCPDTQSESIKNRQAVVFFNWLDFINQLVIESHTLIKTSIRHSIGDIFLEDAFKISNLSRPETMAILHKYYSGTTAPELLAGFHKWLIVEGNEPDVPGISTNSLLKALIDNCSSDNRFVAVFSLKFFVEVLNKCDGNLLQCLILCYLKDRCYYDTSAVPASWSDEEDERQKYSSSPEALSSSRTLAPSNVDKIIQSFSNITPIQLRSQNTEENVEQLKKHYEQVMKRCAEYHWPTEAVSDVETLSNDSNPEVDTHFRRFYEGPFLRMIFTKIKYIHTLNYCQMLQVSAIVSKLALLPHPFLHEYLLNPFLPLRNGIKSLFSSLKFAMSDVSSRVHIILNFQQELNSTRERLLNESELAESKGEIDRYLEACVVLEELCNQLAAIIYVKYAYFHLSSS